MDFAMLPPEVNSGRMYAGPGSGPMLAAAAAWDGLAADLHSAAASYGSVISGLTGGTWLGPASASMAAAAAPYVAWMSATATQAEQTGAQAKAAASAYGAAFAMTVPPPVIAANRAQLAALVATNLLGQNTAAIMATEAHYGEMWAQDAAAMYGYAGASASASTLTPFTPPKPTTNPAGPTPLSAVSGLTGSLKGAVTSANTAATAVTGLSGSDIGLVEDTAGFGIDAVGFAGPEAGGFAIEAAGTFYEVAGMGAAAPAADLGGLSALPSLGAFGGWGGAGASASIGSLGTAGASASIGQAASVGALSVPPSWSPALPAIRPAAMELSATSLSATPEVLTAPSGNMFSEMALASMAGRAVGSTASQGRRDRTLVTTWERAELPQRPPGSPGSVAELRQLTEVLRELAALRDSGILTAEEFNEQKRRLLGH